MNGVQATPIEKICTLVAKVSTSLSRIAAKLMRPCSMSMTREISASTAPTSVGG